MSRIVIAPPLSALIMMMSSGFWSSVNALISLRVRLFVLLYLDLEISSLTWFSNDSIKVLIVWVSIWWCPFVVGLWSKMCRFIVLVHW